MLRELEVLAWGLLHQASQSDVVEACRRNVPQARGRAAGGGLQCLPHLRDVDVVLGRHLGIGPLVQLDVDLLCPQRHLALEEALEPLVRNDDHAADGAHDVCRSLGKCREQGGRVDARVVARAVGDRGLERRIADERGHELVHIGWLHRAHGRKDHTAPDGREA